jgi:capsular polysaccharide biosynthesis protein
LLHTACRTPYGLPVESRVNGDEWPQQITLARLTAIAKRRWWALLAGMLGSVVLVAGLGSQGPRYQAEMTFLVGPIGAEYSQLRAAGQQAQTYAELVTSGPVLQGASARLHRTRTVAQLRGAVNASADFYTRLLTIDSVDRGRAEALATGAAVAAELQRVTRGRRPQGGSQLTLVEPARIAAQTGGAAKKLVAIGALTGVLGALTLLVIADVANASRGRRDRLVSRPA